MFNDTPNSRSQGRKLKSILLNDTPKCRSAGGCPVCYAGRMGRPEGVSKM
ncbi:MAG: hypothetical protein WC721_13670 [Victivallaceae bacterium]